MTCIHSSASCRVACQREMLHVAVDMLGQSHCHSTLLPTERVRGARERRAHHQGRAARAWQRRYCLRCMWTSERQHAAAAQAAKVLAWHVMPGCIPTAMASTAGFMSSRHDCDLFSWLAAVPMAFTAGFVQSSHHCNVPSWLATFEQH